MNQELRKGEDHVGVAVCGICHDAEGNILFNKRSVNARDEHGRWDIMGGGLEFEDTVEDTLKKEIAEEFCTDVLDYKFLGYNDVHRELNGKKTHWVALIFDVLIDREKVKNGEPHKFDALEWFTLDTLPSPLHSQAPKYLELYRSNVKEYKK